jgi:hypothetical protein
MTMTEHGSDVSVPAVSVIVPLYNKQTHVARTLQSVLAQDWTDFEIVVVDDGSTDSGPEHVLACGDPRIRLIRQPNAGPGAARNRGLRESRGLLAAFLDADDEWLPGLLRTSVQHLANHPDCAACVSGYYEGTQKRERATRADSPLFRPGVWRLPAGVSAWRVKQAVESTWTGTVVCRREVALRLGGFYENRCTYGEDGYLWLKLLLTQSLYRNPTPLAWYHTDASELGIHGRTRLPVRPVLTDPGPIRALCPDSHRSALEEYLALMALLTARRHVVYGDIATARWAVQAYPRMRRFRKEYALLRCEMLAEPLLRRVGWATLHRWHRRITGRRGKP